MKKIGIIYCIALFVFSSCQIEIDKKKTKSKEKNTTQISFYTKDNIQIFGDLYKINKTSPTIILFHQARSNARGEYATIIPRLTNEGFNVLAIDQRSGGQLFGKHNRTIAEFPKNSFNYCDAYADLESAVKFIIDKKFTGKKIVWGSSYSASLAIKIAHENQQQIQGVLAFSPASGGPMSNCKADEYFETLKTSLLLLRPSKEMEIESVKKQFNTAKKYNHKTFIAKNGVHGSSMLVEDRVQNNVDENWKVVLAFINEFK
jgi:alpha-beta hydrolase superfamily lysophospholipase